MFILMARFSKARKHRLYSPVRMVKKGFCISITYISHIAKTTERLVACLFWPQMLPNRLLRNKKYGKVKKTTENSLLIFLFHFIPATPMVISYCITRQLFGFGDVCRSQK